MSAERKILGVALIGLGLISKDKVARFGLSALGLTVMFPKETMEVIDIAGKTFAKKKSDGSKPDKNDVRVTSAQQAAVVEQVGVIRRFGNWCVRSANNFWKWLW